MSTTLTPFLYQTRTILRASVSVRSLSTTAGRLHAHPRTRGEQSIPFEWDGPVEERADIPSGPDGERKSTITPTERHIFRGIFDDIAKRGGHPLPQTTKDAVDTAAAASSSQVEPESGSRDAILRKYPLALRRAAEVALGMRQVQGDQVNSSRISFKPEEELEADLEEAAKLDAARRDARAQEAVRLQALLDQCNTDVEVWTVLERDVFSMVARLGISEDKPEPDAEKKAKSAQKRSSKKTQPGHSVDALSMDSHGPLYSMHLLQGLKTLDQSFARSSPLALNVLPRVKDLGLASYVLGVSTPFYNELASILWYRHGDTQAVLAVLDEMQFAGLFYDMQTLRLVDAIELALDSFRGGKLGVFSKAIGTMPGYNLDVKSKVARYARRVRHSIREQTGSARY